MAPRPVRATLVASVTLDADGAGTADVVTRTDFAVDHTRVTCSAQSQALLYLDGKEFEGTYSGNGDQSDTRHLMAAGDILQCRWTGGDPGAVATIYVRGVAYPPGTGPVS